MNTADIDLSLLRKLELFSSLDQKNINFVASHSGTLELPKGRLLFSSGEKAFRFFVLTAGEIRVFRANSDGSEEEMARFTAGDTIGDFDFARGAEYDACAEAAEASRLIEFPANGGTMDSLALEEPQTVCSILLNAIEMMTRRIKSIHKLILENMHWVKELHRRAYEDPGTGLWKQILIADEITGVLKDPSALIMLKPDRFKILVDSRGHSVGDETMVRIAIILKNIVRQAGQGWALRFKSNEVGMILNNCEEDEAEEIANNLFGFIADMEPVAARDGLPEFTFTATIAWSQWAQDDPEWESLFQGTYAALMKGWHEGGEKIIRYHKTADA
jgi:diguanylate cyclase (GGDEF)-like protein